VDESRSLSRHIQQKLRDVVRSLALDPRRLPERLDKAAAQLVEIDASDFDNEADRKEFEELVERLTREPAIGDEGAVAATVLIMSRDDSHEITRRIVDLATRYF
jgi:tagatose-1,6-bisphosphate aldolase